MIFQLSLGRITCQEEARMVAVREFVRLGKKTEGAGGGHQCLTNVLASSSTLSKFRVPREAHLFGGSVIVLFLQFLFFFLFFFFF